MSDDVKALIARARELAQASGDEYPEWAYVEASPREAALMMYRLREFVEQMADALEAVSARPLMADREAVLKVLSDPQWERSNMVYEWPDDEAEAYRAKGWSEGVAAARAILHGKQADALFASGVIQSKGDVQAEALEEAADELDEHGVPLSLAVQDWLRARAAAYRTPASPNEGNE